LFVVALLRLLNTLGLLKLPDAIVT